MSALSDQLSALSQKETNFSVNVSRTTRATKYSPGTALPPTKLRADG